MSRHESKESTPAKASSSSSKASSAKKQGSPSATGVGTSSASRPTSTVPSRIQRAVDQLLELGPMLKRLDVESTALAVIIKEGMVRHGLRRLQATTGHANLQERTTTKTDTTRLPPELKVVYDAVHQTARQCVGVTHALYRHPNDTCEARGRVTGEAAIPLAKAGESLNDVLGRLLAVDVVRKRIDKAVDMLVAQVKEHMRPRHVRRINSAYGYVELLDRRQFDVQYKLIPAAMLSSYLRAGETARVSSSIFYLMHHPTRTLEVGGFMAASKFDGFPRRRVGYKRGGPAPLN